MHLLSLILIAPAFQGAELSLSTLKVVDGVHPVAISAAPTGRRVAIALEDGTVYIVDAESRATVRKLAKHPQPCYALAWSRDGNYLATGDESARIFVEDTRTGEQVQSYRSAPRGIQKLSFNVTGNYLAATVKDDTIRVYDVTVEDPKEKYLILGKGANFYGGVFPPNQPTTILTGILGSGARQYNIETGKVTAFITGHDRQGVYDVAFNPAGTRVVSAGRDGTAILWDTRGFEKLGSFIGHKDWVMTAGFSPNGRYVVTSSTDRTIRIWNMFSFKKVVELTDSSVSSCSIACHSLLR